MLQIHCVTTSEGHSDCLAPLAWAPALGSFEPTCSQGSPRVLPKLFCVSTTVKLRWLLAHFWELPSFQAGTGVIKCHC